LVDVVSVLNDNTTGAVTGIFSNIFLFMVVHIEVTVLYALLLTVDNEFIPVVEVGLEFEDEESSEDKFEFEFEFPLDIEIVSLV
jgi:hypothetical protein